MGIQRYISIIAFLMIITTPVLAAASEGDGIIEKGESKTDELTKAAQNPMAELISLPIQNNTNFGYGPLNETQNITNIQPVIPFRLSEDWNLITRTIIPLIDQPGFIPGQGRKFGLGDINLALFVGPRDPGKFIWGAGPIFMLPTASHERLGAEKWGAGPAAVGLTMQGPWVFGALAQNIWSFAGNDDRPDVNQFLFQYFVNYNLPDGWYLTSSPIITANWEADSDNRWTVPVGGGFGKLFTIGKLPVNAQIQAYYNVIQPDDLGPDWSMRLQVQFLFPKSW
jgi:hypothetical protein